MPAWESHLLQRTLRTLHPSDHYPFRYIPMPELSSRRFPNRAAWETYRYNPPEWRSGGADDRPEVVPKPTWAEILDGMARLPDLALYELNDIFGPYGGDLPTGRFHAEVEAGIAREFFGTSQSHEHYVRERLTYSESATRLAHRLAWVRHRRRRYHQAVGWLRSLPTAFRDDRDSLTGEGVAYICEFSFREPALWGGAAPFAPPFGTVPDDAVEPDDPHPGPPPGWRPRMLRPAGSFGRAYAYALDLPYAAEIEIAAATGDPPPGMILRTGQEGRTTRHALGETIVHAPTGFTDEQFFVLVSLPTGIDALPLVLRYRVTEYGIGGEIAFTVAPAPVETA